MWLFGVPNNSLVCLAVLSSVLLSGSVSSFVQGIVAVVAVVGFVTSYAFGLGAGEGSFAQLASLRLSD